MTAVSAFPCPSALAAYGRAVRTYHPRAITNSQYTRYQRGASPGDGYDALSDGVDAVCRRVRKAQAPTFHYLYIPDVDGAAHRHGWDAPEAHAALANVDAQLAPLAEATRPAGTNGSGVRIVMSADHGMLTVPEESKHVMRADDPIMAALRFPPSGDPRAPLFHVRLDKRSRSGRSSASAGANGSRCSRSGKRKSWRCSGRNRCPRRRRRGSAISWASLRGRRAPL